MRVLVTGSDGFVGRHLCAGLAAADHDVVPMPGSAHGGIDVRDPAAVGAAVAASGAEAIVHLAAISSVRRSHEDPRLTWDVNATGVLNLLLAVRERTPRARVLLVSSGEVYGSTAVDRPAVETDPCLPASPYAGSKLAAETIALQLQRGSGLDVVVARPFNHIGRGQDPGFAVPSFAAQARAVKRGASAAVRAGRLDVVRDFLHVDDVVRAYELLLRSGTSGHVYNIGSGIGRSLGDVLTELLQLAGVDPGAVQIDPQRLRSSDAAVLVGDPSRLRALGWEPRRALGEALREVLDEQGG